LYSSRMLPFFAIVTVPIAAQTFSNWLKQDFPQNRVSVIESNINAINQSSNGMIWVFTVVLAVFMLFTLNKPVDTENKGNVFDPQFFPVEAVSWLESHPQSGHVFNEFDWGGYMLLKLWPAYQIFMDGHTHIYGEKLTREYEHVITLSNNWELVFDKYQITWVIVRVDSVIANALKNKGWENLYQDATATILSKP